MGPSNLRTESTDQDLSYNTSNNPLDKDEGGTFDDPVSNDENNFKKFKIRKYIKNMEDM